MYGHAQKPILPPILCSNMATVFINLYSDRKKENHTSKHINTLVETSVMRVIAMCGNLYHRPHTI